MTHSQALEKILTIVDDRKNQGLMGPRVGYYVAFLAFLFSFANAGYMSYLIATKADSEEQISLLSSGSHYLEQAANISLSASKIASPSLQGNDNAKSGYQHAMTDIASRTFHAITASGIVVIVGLIVYGAILQYLQSREKKNLSNTILFVSYFLESLKSIPESDEQTKVIWENKLDSFFAQCESNKCKKGIPKPSQGTFLLIYHIITDYKRLPV